jgi:hypothetical protein
MRGHDAYEYEWLLKEGERRARTNYIPLTPGEVVRGMGVLIMCALAFVLCVNACLLVAGS